VFKPDEDRHEYCCRSHAQLARAERYDLADGFIAEMPPRAKQIWFGRKKGSEAGHLGGRPMATLTDEEKAKVARLASRGWGRRAIATQLLVSERAVRNVLDS
jgi:DNA-binding NarL/FixJ family response regulator